MVSVVWMDQVRRNAINTKLKQVGGLAFTFGTEYTL